jgi:hypothetical protein
MHQLATGPGALALVGSEPPLSPETIGRAPSSFEPAVPLPSLEELVGLSGRPEAAAPPVAAAPPAEAPTDPRRLVVRVLGGEDVEVGLFDGPDAAIARAKEIVGSIATAEASGMWPELDGRYLRPASIVSIDVVAVG